MSVGRRLGTHRWERRALVADDGDRFNVNACASEDDKTGTSASAVRQNKAPDESKSPAWGPLRVGGSLGPTHGMSDVLGVDRNTFGPLAWRVDQSPLVLVRRMPNGSIPRMSPNESTSFQPKRLEEAS
jgi:hypothetical protein